MGKKGRKTRKQRDPSSEEEVPAHNTRSRPSKNNPKTKPRNSSSESNASSMSSSSSDNAKALKPNLRQHREHRSSRRKSSPTPTSKNVHVFKGQNYADWRFCFEQTLFDNKLDDLLHPSEDEAAFKLMSKPERREKMYKYTRKQNTAQLLLTDRLDLSLIKKIRTCDTVREMIEKLDTEFTVQSFIGLIGKRSAYYNMRFNEGGDLKKYIDAHESRAVEYEEAGGVIQMMDRVLTLHSSIPPKYDSILCYPSAMTNYQTYRKLLIEQYERTSMMEGKPTSESRKSTEQPKRDTEKKTNTSKSYNHTKTCYNCNETGHVARDCENEKKNSAAVDKSNPESKETKQPEKPTDNLKPDWLKSKNFKSMNITLSEKAKNTIRELDDNIPSKPTILMINTAEDLSTQFEISNDDKKLTENAEFLLDSGAQCHLVNSLEFLLNPYPITDFRLNCANSKAPLFASHYGVLHLRTKTNVLLELKNVFYVKDLPCNLLSVGRITRNGEFGVDFRGLVADVYELESREIIFSGRVCEGLVYVKLSTSLELGSVFANNANIRTIDNVPLTSVIQCDRENKSFELAKLYHERAAHPSAKYLRLMCQNVENVPRLKINDFMFRDCLICLQAKSTKLPHNTERRKSSRIFEIITTDLYDFGEPSITGKKLAVTFTCAFSGYIRIIPIERKSDVPLEFANYTKFIENKFETRVATLRSDKAKELISGDLELFCKQAGIESDSGNRYSPQLNGLSERKNRDINVKTKAMLYEAKLPTKYWEYAIEALEYVINITPTKTNALFKTPFEIVHGLKPDGSRLRVFGSIAMVHIPKEAREREATKERLKQKKTCSGIQPTGAKLRPSAERLIFIGYTRTGYTLNPLSQKTVESRDIAYWFENLRITDVWPKIFDLPQILPAPIQSSSKPQAALSPENLSSQQPAHSSKQVPQKPAKKQTIKPYNPDHTYARANVVTLCQKRIRFLSDYIPRNFREAVNGEYASVWIEAMDREFQSHAENGTWTLVEHPGKNKNILFTQWIYDVKINTVGEQLAKARLVAIGSADKNEYTDDALYTPVCPIDVIRLVLSIANKYSMTLTSMDVSTAFLYGVLDHEIYLRIPKGLDLDKNTKVLKLNKAIYGLKISSKCWYETLKTAIEDIGYLPATAEKCLFYARESGSIALLAIYADDMILATNSHEMRESTINLMEKRFKIKVCRDPKRFVGLEMIQTKSAIHLHQRTYIENMVRELDLTGMHSCSTPMEAYLKIEKSTELCEDIEFRRLIGIILYISRFSRPDVAYPVHALARHQGYMTPTVKAYARRVLKYLYDTRDLVLTYESRDSCPYRNYCDASYAPDVSYAENQPTDIESSAYSVSGFIVLHYGNITHWGTSLQSIMATSSTAAEVIAVCENLDFFLIPRDIGSELFAITNPAIIHEDNTSASRMLKGCNNKKMRHILIKAAAIQAAEKQKEIEILDTEGKKQLADLLTKALPAETFFPLRNQLLHKIENE